MAYMNQERKKKIAKALKVALKGTDVKYSLSVSNHSGINFNMKSAPFDFMGMINEGSEHKRDHATANHFHLENTFSGKALEILKKIQDCLDMIGTDSANFDNSDIQSDYFNIGWYTYINIGKWDTPFIISD